MKQVLIDIRYFRVASIQKFIFNNGLVETPIVKPSLGDSAGVFGAAYLTV